MDYDNSDISGLDFIMQGLTINMKIVQATDFVGTLIHVLVVF